MKSIASSASANKIKPIIKPQLPRRAPSVVKPVAQQQQSPKVDTPTELDVPKPVSSPNDKEQTEAKQEVDVGIDTKVEKQPHKITNLSEMETTSIAIGAAQQPEPKKAKDADVTLESPSAAVPDKVDSSKQTTENETEPLQQTTPAAVSLASDVTSYSKDSAPPWYEMTGIHSIKITGFEVRDGDGLFAGQFLVYPMEVQTGAPVPVRTDLRRMV